MSERLMTMYDIDPNQIRNLRAVDAIDGDKILITPHLKHDLWKLRIEKMVKAAKETLASQWMAPTLLIVLLGYNVYDRQTSGTKLNEMHDAILTLQVEKRMASESAEKDKQTALLIQDSRYQEERAWRENIKNQMNKLELNKTGKIPSQQSN